MAEFLDGKRQAGAEKSGRGLRRVLQEPPQEKPHAVMIL